MLDALIWLLAGAPCLVVSWVAGSYLLSLGRPQTSADLLQLLSALALCVYGIALAFAPVCAEAAPLAATIGWRMALASAAVQFYERVFGWRGLARSLRAACVGLRAWWMRYVELGRAAAGHGRGAE